MADGVRNLLDSLLDRQSRDWLAGRRPTVAELLAGSPLAADPDAQLDLIYNEIVLREELGEEPPAAEYAGRYPHLRDELALHFEVHRAMSDGDGVLSETARLGAMDTLPDAVPPVEVSVPEPPEYDVLGLLGRGGMGVVYKARHRRLRRPVALKMFEPGRKPSPRDVLRFRAEAEAIARLRHPHVVLIHEIGEWNGLPFLALELCDGGTLADKLKQLALPPREAAALIEQVARAVQAAHAAGIVHRDLKPANVLFTADGTPRVTDFGLAKVLQEDADAPRDATRTGEPIGTPRYMAPEQASARHDLVGPATDVYALGTLLFECLTGRVPFLATSVVDTLDQIRNDDPPSPRRFQPGVPRDLATICLACLHKEPDRRYPSAEAVADDLRRFLDGKPITARPTPPWERAWKWCRRRPAHATLIAVGLLLLVAGLTAAGIREREERKRIAAARAEVEDLIQQGQEALARQDERTAAERFQKAWRVVKAEPALRDYHTGVSGWLDHAQRAVTRYHWKQRVPPPEFDAKRDEALFLGLLLDGDRPAAVAAAREAVAAALELTLPDPAWRAEREQLVLLDAELVRAAGGPAAALARLDAAAGFDSRLFHTRRACYLDELALPDEAAAARRRAAQFPPDETPARLCAGADRVRARDFAAAAREFDAVLAADPEHFAARLFAAACALHLDRPGEAKVGLTACVAQRPRFAWAYLYRGRCAQKLGDPAAAKRDFDRAAELRPGLPAR
jgi:tetratricopeptide (TPR) repeat protein